MFVVLLAMASLSARDQSAENSATKPSIEATSTALTFEGSDAADPVKQLAHGKRLSHVLCCTGCYTPTLKWELFNKDAPEMGKLFASNLTQVIPAISGEQLETLLRKGTHPTRGDLWIMPSRVFQRLSAADIAALFAHLRTVKPSGKPTPPPKISAKAREAISTGKMRPVAQWVAQYRTEVPAAMGEEHRWGQHKTSITCAECHGGDLDEVPDFEPRMSTPDLAIAGAYSETELARMLATGEGKTRKDLSLMTLVGKGHFSFLAPRERDAIVAYVKARADRPQ